MNVEDFKLNKDDNGNEFVTFAESPTKTRQGGLRVQLCNPKCSQLVNHDVLWPLFKSYLPKRPEDLKLSGPFYLTCIDNPTTTDVKLGNNFTCVMSKF